MTTQDPFNLVRTAYQGQPIRYAGVVWQVPPVYAPDGVTVLTPGVPMDLSGWVLMFTMKRFVTDPDSAAVFLLDWKIVTGTDGAFAWEVPDTVTAGLEPRGFPWDTRAIRAAGLDPEPFLAGTNVIKASVTRRLTPNLTP